MRDYRRGYLQPEISKKRRIVSTMKSRPASTPADAVKEMKWRRPVGGKSNMLIRMTNELARSSAVIIQAIITIDREKDMIKHPTLLLMSYILPES